MPRFPVLPILVIVTACSKPEQAPVSVPADWTVTAAAIGTTRFGQSPADFARSQSTTPDTTVGGDRCGYWTPTGAPAGLSLMIDSGKVVRVDVDGSGAKTAKGIGVGSTIAEVEAAYVGLQSQPHKYNYEIGWRSLIAWESDSSAAIVFEVDSNVVRKPHAGLRPQALWVERCS